eukprot:1922565-Pyramimonas_sp.AAC.1
MHRQGAAILRPHLLGPCKICPAFGPGAFHGHRDRQTTTQEEEHPWRPPWGPAGLDRPDAQHAT